MTLYVWKYLMITSLSVCYVLDQSSRMPWSTPLHMIKGRSELSQHSTFFLHFILELLNLLSQLIFTFSIPNYWQYPKVDESTHLNTWAGESELDNLHACTNELIVCYKCYTLYFCTVSRDIFHLLLYPCLTIFVWYVVLHY